MTEHPLCETCKFYVGDTIDGTCRRYPPTHIDRVTYRLYYPKIAAYFFCGEWKPLKVKARKLD